MIYNVDGLVAMRHYTSNPSLVEVSGRQYQFSPSYNVSLCWVSPDDVAQLLSMSANVCCGRTIKKFRIANQNDVSIHTSGHI